MSSDIVERLTIQQQSCPSCTQPHNRIGSQIMGIWCDRCEAEEAAINHTATLTASLDAERAEVERLRAAGDALTHSLLMFQSKYRDRDVGYDAISAWDQVRRGGR